MSKKDDAAPETAGEGELTPEQTNQDDAETAGEGELTLEQKCAEFEARIAQLESEAVNADDELKVEQAKVLQLEDEVAKLKAAKPKAKSAAKDGPPTVTEWQDPAKENAWSTTEVHDATYERTYGNDATQTVIGVAKTLGGVVEYSADSFRSVVDGARDTFMDLVTSGIVGLPALPVSDDSGGRVRVSVSIQIEAV